MTKGKFYLIPVPIGNSEDITLRSLKMLKEVDLILAEDTRTTALLLSAYQISTPLKSYHQYNERSRVSEVIDELEQGKNIGLVSDAGMPCISDPGSILVQSLIERQIQVMALPGANAALTALIASGLNTDHFFYFGFLESNGKIRKDQLKRLKDIEETFILYEAPHRLLKTLQDLMMNDLAKRRIAVGRELTKKYENYFYGTVEDALTHYQIEKPRGEFVLVMEGKHEFLTHHLTDHQQEADQIFAEALQDLEILLAGGMRLKSAANYLADKYSVSKNGLYQSGLEKNRNI